MTDPTPPATDNRNSSTSRRDDEYEKLLDRTEASGAHSWLPVRRFCRCSSIAGARPSSRSCSPSSTTRSASSRSGQPGGTRRDRRVASATTPTRSALNDSLDKEELVTVLQAGSISNNVGRRLERDQRFYEDRLVFETQENGTRSVLGIWRPRPTGGMHRWRYGTSQRPPPGVEERIIQPDIIASWSTSITNSITRPGRDSRSGDRDGLPSKHRSGSPTTRSIRSSSSGGPG